MSLIWRKAKIPISAANYRYLEIFATILWVGVPHFRFEKDSNFYLNPSHAAPKDGISVSLRQAAGNPTLNIR